MILGIILLTAFAMAKGTIHDSREGAKNVYVLWGSVKDRDGNGMVYYNPYIVGVFSNRDRAEEMKNMDKNATAIEEFEVVE